MPAGALLLDHRAQDGQLLARSAEDGSQVWEVSVPAAELDSAIATGAKVVLATAGTLLALDLDRGRVVWRTPLPWNDAGRLIEACGDHVLLCWNAKDANGEVRTWYALRRSADGAEVWRRSCDGCFPDADGQDGVALRSYSRAEAVVACGDGEPIPGRTAPIIPSSRVVETGGVDVSWAAQTLTALDWTRSFTRVDEVQALGRDLLVAADGAIRSIDVRSGQQHWALFLDAELYRGVLAGTWVDAGDRTVALFADIAGSLGGVVLLVDAADGRPRRLLGGLTNETLSSHASMLVAIGPQGWRALRFDRVDAAPRTSRPLRAELDAALDEMANYPEPAADAADRGYRARAQLPKWWARVADDSAWRKLIERFTAGDAHTMRNLAPALDGAHRPDARAALHEGLRRMRGKPPGSTVLDAVLALGQSLERPDAEEQSWLAELAFDWLSSTSTRAFELGRSGPANRRLEVAPPADVETSLAIRGAHTWSLLSWVFASDGLAVSDVALVSRLEEAIADRGPAPPAAGRVRIAAGARADRDGDGWPDAVERLLGIRADQQDTDGDGTPDGRDPSPRCRPTDRDDEVAKIDRAVLFHELAVTPAADPVIVAREQTGCLEVPVLGGALFFLDARERQTLMEAVGVNKLLYFTMEARVPASPEDVRNFDRPAAETASLGRPRRERTPVDWNRAEAAIVEISYYRGPLWGAGYRLLLTKEHGRWRVASRKQTWVS